MDAHLEGSDDLAVVGLDVHGLPGNDLAIGLLFLELTGEIFESDVLDFY